MHYCLHNNIPPWGVLFFLFFGLGDSRLMCYGGFTQGDLGQGKRGAQISSPCDRIRSFRFNG